MDILTRIEKYDCSDGGHCDAAQGSAYDLLQDAATEIAYLRTVFRRIADQRTDPVNAARDVLAGINV